MAPQRNSRRVPGTLRLPAGDADIESLNQGHVGIDVARCREQRANAGQLFPEIKVAEGDGHTGAVSDVVEAGLPVGDRAARSLGGK